jgi:hypothetical protein
MRVGEVVLAEQVLAVVVAVRCAHHSVYVLLRGLVRVEVLQQPPEQGAAILYLVALGEAVAAECVDRQHVVRVCRQPHAPRDIGGVPHEAGPEADTLANARTSRAIRRRGTCRTFSRCRRGKGRCGRSPVRGGLEFAPGRRQKSSGGRNRLKPWLSSSSRPLRHVP